MSRGRSPERSSNPKPFVHRGHPVLGCPSARPARIASYWRIQSDAEARPSATLDGRASGSGFPGQQSSCPWRLSRPRNKHLVRRSGPANPYGRWASRRCSSPTAGPITRRGRRQGQRRRAYLGLYKDLASCDRRDRGLGVRATPVVRAMDRLEARFRRTSSASPSPACAARMSAPASRSATMGLSHRDQASRPSPSALTGLATAPELHVHRLRVPVAESPLGQGQGAPRRPLRRSW